MIKFIAWADTHWDKLGAKCVTLDDTDLVERALFKRAEEWGADFTLFAGDRFLKREPDDETKVRADRVFYDLVHKGKIPHYHLIGNHDWVDNTRKWHTAQSIKWFDHLTVMDRSMTYKHNSEVLIHSLPADFPFVYSSYEVDPAKLNLFVFHDAVRGCFLNEEKTFALDSGLDLSSIDLPVWDLVLAGDIHIRQQLPFKHTAGGYLGSVVQRTRADANAARGWTEITVYKEDTWKFEINFVPVRNFFTRLHFDVHEKTDFMDLKSSMHSSLLVDQLVEVTLSGMRRDVDRVADDPGWRLLEKESQARRVELLRGYKTEQAEAVVDLSESSDVYTDLDLYLKSNFSSVGRLKSDRIMDVLHKVKEGRA